METAETTRRMKMILTVIAIKRIKQYKTSLKDNKEEVKSEKSFCARFSLILNICKFIATQL
jgi:hypothetical protein